MIKLTLPMPRLGETMEEGTIAQWLVEPGQIFKRGDPLLEIETDKTMVEYPALGDGTLLENMVDRGDVIEVGTPIAVIETADIWDGIEDVETQALAPVVPEPSPAPEPEIRETSPRDKLRATPLARRIAKQNGIALMDVPGSGRRGRIEADDVRAMVSAPSPAMKRSTDATLAYCVHGFAGLGSGWAVLRKQLQKVGVKTHAPDLPGHGSNETEALGVQTLIDWLADDLARQSEPVHLIGHSLGAHVAVAAALRVQNKVARLTLLTPAGCGYQINGSFPQGMAAGPGVGVLAHLMRLLGPKAESFESEALRALASDLQRGRLTALANDMARGDHQLIDTIGPLQRLSQDIPVRAIFGLRDRIIPREHAFNLPSRAACHMVDAGHMPHWDATETVAAIIATG